MPTDPRTPPESPLQADGLTPLHEEPDPRDFTEEEREASWLQAGGFEVG